MLATARIQKPCGLAVFADLRLRARGDVEAPCIQHYKSRGKFVAPPTGSKAVYPPSYKSVRLFEA